MNPQTNQSDITPEEAKASMGIATHLMGGLLQPLQTPDSAPQAPSNQTTAQDTQNQMQGLETRIFDELGTLREEIKQIANPKDRNAEIEDLKKQIDQVLSSSE